MTDIRRACVVDSTALRSFGSGDAPVTVLLVCPTLWDEAELPHIVKGGGFRVLAYGADVSEYLAHFDALAFIDRHA